MNWIDHGSYIEIYPPREFNFEECLLFLGRSDHEVLHRIVDGVLYKLIKIEDSLIVCKIGYYNNCMKVEFPFSNSSAHVRKLVGEYIWEWFDLSQDLVGFYQMASNDTILQKLANKYYGLRIMCIPDLFEALSWAIMGQQINLSFAYTLKKRFVERFGESVEYEGETLWVFPTHEKIAQLNVDELKELQFTTRKAEYIIGIARELKSGNLAKGKLLHLKDYYQVKKAIMEIRGVGAWTADYVMMKCLHHTTALPITDVGLHNALKNVFGRQVKPTIEEIEKYAIEWEGWQAYATFYLWRSLYDETI